MLPPLKIRYRPKPGRANVSDKLIHVAAARICRFAQLGIGLNAERKAHPGVKLRGSQGRAVQGCTAFSLGT